MNQQVFAPHTARELWEAMNSASAITALEKPQLEAQCWPVIDDDADIDFVLMVGWCICAAISNSVLDPLKNRRLTCGLIFLVIKGRSGQDSGWCRLCRR